MKEDGALLRDYAEAGSEAAFAELVRRRVGLVYSVALRQTRDAQRAQDVAQVVFTDLARRASTLTHLPVLAGWLYRRAHYATSDILRAERSRAVREQEAHFMQQLAADETPAPDWDKVRPVLDEALNEMDGRDRDAILLRFIDGQSFAVVGARLALSENAARMRVERALDKLRLRLGRRGVTSTTAALAVALGHPAMATAPAGLAVAVTGAALSGAAVAGGVGATLLSTFLMKTSTAVFSIVVVIAAVGVAVFQTRHAQRIEAELATLARDRDALTSRLRAAEELGLREKERAVAAERQATQLRSEAAKVVAAAAKPVAAPAATPASTAPTQSVGWTAFTPTSGDPADAKRRIRENNIQTRYINYQALFHVAGFSSQQREQFRALIAADVDHSDEVLQAALTTASAQTGGDRAAMQKVFDATNAQLAAEFQSAVRATFGDGATEALVRHQETTPVRLLVAELSQQLFYSETPLSVAQATQLVDVLAGAARNPQGKVDLAALAPEAMAALAQGVVSPAQLPAFRNALRSNQLRFATGR